jgi:hypothetical protein
MIEVQCLKEKSLPRLLKFSAPRLPYHVSLQHPVPVIMPRIRAGQAFCA